MHEDISVDHCAHPVLTTVSSTVIHVCDAFQLNSSVSEELLKLSYRMNQVQSVVTSAQQKFSILGGF